MDTLWSLKASVDSNFYISEQRHFSVILDKQIGPAEIMLPCCQDTFYYYVKSIKCLGNVTVVKATL